MRFKKVSNKEINENYDNKFEIASIFKESGGYILKNKNFFKSLFLTSLNKFVLKKAVYGTNIFKIGDFDENILLISGIHGNELASQIAILLLFEDLLNSNLEKTVYLIPFAAPHATMNNTRRFGSMDLNRAAFIDGSLSNKIIDLIVDLKISAVGDFHTTGENSNPGVESIFCSEKPSSESSKIASYIGNDMGSKIIQSEKAGFPFKGAIEDESNLRGIPSITCEVLSPFGDIKNGSIARSYLQMKSFLSYFDI